MNRVGFSGNFNYLTTMKAETCEKPGRAQELNRELGHLQHDLAELNPKWEEQATRLAALE
jgi:hypothetical protein